MDITSRRNTVDAMHLCDKALASTSEAIIITDPNLPDNPIIYCNQGFEALTGLSYPPKSLPAESAQSIAHVVVLQDCSAPLGDCICVWVGVMAAACAASYNVNIWFTKLLSDTLPHVSSTSPHL